MIVIVVAIAMAIGLLFVTEECEPQQLCAKASMVQNIPATDRGVFSFTMKTIDGKDKRLADYQGNVLLVVNTASKCGFTAQYSTLEKLYEKYKDRGFRILAFPANNFGGQEPGSNGDIKNFCSTNYGVSFDLFSKISVKGDDIHPLYAYLTKDSGFPGDIKWNFNKFLVDRHGKVVARFDSKTDPMSDELVTQVESLLTAS